MAEKPRTHPTMTYITATPRGPRYSSYYYPPLGTILRGRRQCFNQLHSANTSTASLTTPNDTTRPLSMNALSRFCTRRITSPTYYASIVSAPAHPPSSLDVPHVLPAHTSIRLRFRELLALCISSRSLCVSVLHSYAEQTYAGMVSNPTTILRDG